MVDIALSLGTGAADTVRELVRRGGLPSAQANTALLPFAVAQGFGSLALARVTASYWHALTVTLEVDSVAAALRAGLDTEVKDVRGRTGLCALMQLNRRSTSAATIELASVLLKEGADANARHDGCPLAVWVIMRRGNSAVKLCRLLAAHGLDPLATFIPEDGGPEVPVLAYRNTLRLNQHLQHPAQPNVTPAFRRRCWPSQGRAWAATRWWPFWRALRGM
jgi:hypothetical protein